MKIRTGFQGQAVVVIDAMPHIEAQLMAGRTFPFIELVIDEAQLNQDMLDLTKRETPSLGSRQLTTDMRKRLRG